MLTFLGATSADTDLLARSLLAGRTVTCPAAPAAERWEWDWAAQIDSWRAEVASLPLTDRVVVCTWSEPVARVGLAELGTHEWRRQVEWPTALWFSTLAAAVGRCRAEGSVVAVVERPATLDAIGQSPVVAVAEGLLNLVRSLAAQEGARGVRVNAVVTARHTSDDHLPGAPPPLAQFPGRIDVEVAGAVRLLLSSDACGLTGTTVPATCGRR